MAIDAEMKSWRRRATCSKGRREGKAREKVGDGVERRRRWNSRETQRRRDR